MTSSQLNLLDRKCSSINRDYPSSIDYFTRRAMRHNHRNIIIDNKEGTSHEVLLIVLENNFYH